jgi:uncharacterized protein (TIGR03083 family)
MDMTPSELDEILGAWALDALDGETSAHVDRLVALDPTLAERARALREVVAGLHHTDASAPPAELRRTTLAAAARTPRRIDPGSDVVDLFAHQVAALHELLLSLTPPQWRLRAEPYAWTVHELVAHLLVIERYTAVQLGVVDSTVPGFVPENIGHLAMGGDVIAAEAARAPLDTAAAWHDAASGTVAALRAGRGLALDAPVGLHGWPFTTTTALVARSFEIWTHADDIRRAIDAVPLAPVAADLRTMSSFSVSTLPYVLPLVAPQTEFTGARVVLTGPGGGTFDLGDPEQPATLIVVDVVDYCRLAAKRVSLESLEATIEGDEAMAADLLAASQVFSV